jgi:hypothetical protein
VSKLGDRPQNKKGAGQYHKESRLRRSESASRLYRLTLQSVDTMAARWEQVAETINVLLDIMPSQIRDKHIRFRRRKR